MIPNWLRAIFVRDDRVSDAWLSSHDLQDTKGGVDLPRWRTPAERIEMQRLDRRRALRMVPEQRRAK